MARDVVSLRPQFLDEGVFWPALEFQCSGFNALHFFVSLDTCPFGSADAVVYAFDAFVRDGGDFPSICTEDMSVVRA